MRRVDKVQQTKISIHSKENMRKFIKYNRPTSLWHGETHLRNLFFEIMNKQLKTFRFPESMAPKLSNCDLCAYSEPSDSNNTPEIVNLKKVRGVGDSHIFVLC